MEKETVLQHNAGRATGLLWVIGAAQRPSKSSINDAKKDGMGMQAWGVRKYLAAFKVHLQQLAATKKQRVQTRSRGSDSRPKVRLANWWQRTKKWV
eukprot:1157397-Pelagomonas_calceolata.AAC.2